MLSEIETDFTRGTAQVAREHLTNGSSSCDEAIPVAFEMITLRARALLLIKDQEQFIERIARSLARQQPDVCSGGCDTHFVRCITLLPAHIVQDRPPKSDRLINTVPSTLLKMRKNCVCDCWKKK